MKPISLTLRGAIGIRDGLGEEQIEIDFTRFSPGLICIAGPNGSGKTTILDNLHPFLELPSRNGKLANHFFLRDSLREFMFELDGSTYRSVVFIDSQTRKTEAYLYKDGSPMNDGHISTYENQVVQLMGPPTLFFKSIFAAQGASGITRMTTAERKKLFLELLDLDLYGVYCDYSGSKIREMEMTLSGSRAIAERGRREMEQRAGVETDLYAARVEMEKVNSQLEAKEEEARQIEARFREVQHLIDEQNRRRQQQALLMTEIASLERKLDQAKRNHDGEVELLRAKESQIQQDITRLNTIIERSEEIKSKVGHLHDLRMRNDQLSRLENEWLAWQRTETERIARIQQREHQRAMELARLEREEMKLLSEEQRIRSAVNAELALVSRRLVDTRAVAAPVSAAPCRDTNALVTACALLINARRALEDIPSLEEKQRQLKAEDYYESIGGREAAVKLSDVREVKRKLREQPPVDPLALDPESAQSSLKYDRTAHEEVKKGIGALEMGSWERLAVDLQVADSVLLGKNNLLQSLTAQRSGKETNSRNIFEELKNQIAEKRALGLALVDANDYLSLQQRTGMELAQAERSVAEFRKKERDLHTRIASAESMLQRLEKLEEEMIEQEDKVRVLMKSIEHWKIFQRACSKDGIPALELDAAGPAVSRIANDLLASSFGVRFQIGFETTKLSKDGKKQLETFDIRIMGENGEKHIEDLSGGERVWIERAISEAIAIYLSEKSGKEYLTAFQDESDGALDPDNKQNYLQMLRESFRLGRRHFTFVITQSPDIWQQVEQRIHLSRESSIQLIY